ncbi:DUF7848 domain-containing protein [Streptomyces sp. 4N509B]|uniref:DUF7848 domain-containing protein n=1 Tax=Streptomyces sp. 4N509B TaxID=3457413 RepID=UPI003FD25970
MSAYVVLRGTALKLCAERAAEAPDPLCRVACLTCSAESELVRDDPRPAQLWALGHAEEAGPEHGQFRVTAHRYWRVYPVHAQVGAAPWPPAGRTGGPAVPATLAGDAPRCWRTHARRHGHGRGRGRGRGHEGGGLTHAGRRLGPLLLSALLLVVLVLLGAAAAGGRGHHTVGDSAEGREGP